MKYWFAIALLALLTGCGKELLDTDPVNRGLLPLTPYVAIGGSETAGFADGALHYVAQEYSYPALIAQQLQLVGGGSFAQPLTIDSGGFARRNGEYLARLELRNREDCTGAPTVLPVRQQNTLGTFVSSVATSVAGPYGNLGVPQLSVTDFNRPNLSSVNPYYQRMGTDSLTLMTAIINRSPKLFTIWVGTDDLLAEAIWKVNAGAPLQLYTNLGLLVDSLIQDTTAAGFIATVPDVTEFPFFNTIPYNILELDQAQADALNQLYAGQGMFFQVGLNAPVIEDVDAPGGKRQLLPGEKLFLSLPLDSVKCGGWGSVVPISAQYVLTEQELGLLRYQVTSFNSMIRQLADEKGLVVVDIHGLYHRLKQGIGVNGLRFNATFVHGVFFSLDGLYPSPRGAALIANEFIQVMNAEYRATIPLISVVAQPGIRFP